MRRTKLACVILGDAIERILFGYHVGTPQEHLDRINEFLGRPAATPKNPPAQTGDVAAAGRGDR